MRILYWVQQFWPYIGGIEVLGARLLRELRQRGYEFTVVCSHGELDLPDVDEYETMPVHRFPFYTALQQGDVAELVRTQRRLAELKRQFEPHLVHVNLTDPSVFFHLRTADAHPAAFLLTTRIAIEQEAAGRDTVLGQALSSADWVTTNSGAMLQDLRQLVPEIANRSDVVYNGLEFPPIDPSPLPFEPPHLLCLGRVVRDKGFDLAIEAFAALAGRFPGLRMTIAGDGAARTDLERLAAELGVAARIEFAGWVPPDRVPALIDASTIVLVPSRWREAFGLVALQGAQMARPVVATRVGGLAEVVADGETGLLVEREDAGGLASAVATLLEDPGRARALGAAGRARAGTVFGWTRHVDAYDALYRRLIGARRVSDSGHRSLKAVHSVRPREHF